MPVSSATFGDPVDGPTAIERIADALEIHNTLYLAYLTMAFGQQQTMDILDELGEGDE